jgi:hypothetical protein
MLGRAARFECILLLRLNIPLIITTYKKRFQKFADTPKEIISLNKVRSIANIVDHLQS